MSLPPDPLPGIADPADRMLLAGLDAQAALLAAGADRDVALAAAHDAIHIAQWHETKAAVAAKLEADRAALDARIAARVEATESDERSDTDEPDEMGPACSEPNDA